MVRNTSMHLATIFTPRRFLGKAGRVEWANARPDVERPIRIEEDRSRAETIRAARFLGAITQAGRNAGPNDSDAIPIVRFVPRRKWVSR
jgi:hypothetical protein